MSAVVLEEDFTLLGCREHKTVRWVGAAVDCAAPLPLNGNPVGVWRAAGGKVVVQQHLLRRRHLETSRCACQHNYYCCCCQSNPMQAASHRLLFAEATVGSCAGRRFCGCVFVQCWDSRFTPREKQVAQKSHKNCNTLTSWFVLAWLLQSLWALCLVAWLGFTFSIS